MTTDPFTGTSGPHDANIMIVGEAYGQTEARKGIPFCGNTGEEMDKILAECSINRSDVFCTNVINEQPFNNDMWRFFHPTNEARAMGKPLIRGLYPKDNMIQGLETLHRQIEAVNPKVIIGFGNYALWALTEDSFSIGDDHLCKVPTGITAWRGSQLYDRYTHTPFMPTFHPAAVFRNWSWRYAIKHDIARRMPKALNGEWKEPDRDFIIRPSFDIVEAYLGELILVLDNYPEVDISVDLETRNGHIACCGIGYGTDYSGFETNATISIPFMCAENIEGYWPLEEEVAIIKMLCHILTHPNARLIGQNFLFDAQYFAKWWGIIVKCSFDTMLMHHVCWPGTPMGLGYLSSLYCFHHLYWKDEGKIGEHEEWGIDVPEEQLWSYNCVDVDKTAEIKGHIAKLIKTLGLEFQAETQMAQFDMLLDMQLRGIKIDTKVRAGTSMELMQSIDERLEFLNYVIPEDVLPRKPKAKPWTGSPQQQADLFYDVLGIKGPRNRSTDDANLERIGQVNPILWPITSCIQELRSLRVFNNNFCKARLDPGDRLRCSYNPTAKTFRYKSKKNAFGTGTNLMNIPKGTEE